MVQPRADRARTDPELSGDLAISLPEDHERREPVLVPLDLRTGTPWRTTEASPSRRIVKRYDLGHADLSLCAVDVFPPPAWVDHSPVACHFRGRSEEHTSELQSPYDIVCRLLLEKKK